MPDTDKQVKLRWDRPGSEAAFRHLHDNDLIKQVRRKNANRKKSGQAIIICMQQCVFDCEKDQYA